MDCLFFDRVRLGRVAWVLLSAVFPAGCESGASQHAERDLDAGFVDTGPAPRNGEPITALLPAFCRRDGDDVVRDLFCVDTPPAITNMAQLQLRLGLEPTRVGSRAHAEPMDGGVTGQPSAAADGGVVLNLNVALLSAETSPVETRCRRHAPLRRVAWTGAPCARRGSMRRSLPPISPRADSLPDEAASRPRAAAAATSAATKSDAQKQTARATARCGAEQTNHRRQAC
ncbi:MAG: hypothetical protein RLZZ450_1431 [Pseudomonadota bacterium]